MVPEASIVTFKAAASLQLRCWVRARKAPVTSVKPNWVPMLTATVVGTPATTSGAALTGTKSTTVAKRRPWEGAATGGAATAAVGLAVPAAITTTSPNVNQSASLAHDLCPSSICVYYNTKATGSPNRPSYSVAKLVLELP